MQEIMVVMVSQVLAIVAAAFSIEDSFSASISTISIRCGLTLLRFRSSNASAGLRHVAITGRWSYSFRDSSATRASPMPRFEPWMRTAPELLGVVLDILKSRL